MSSLLLPFSCSVVWTLFYLRDCSPPDSSVQGTSQAGMGCHFHFQGIVLTDPGIKHYISVIRIIEVTQSCLTFCNPMDCSLAGFSVHEIFQARVLEWVAISFSRESS